jgi:hypothetical protein
MDIAITAAKGDTLWLKRVASYSKEFTLVVKDENSLNCFHLFLSQEHVEMLIPDLKELGCKVLTHEEFAEHYHEGVKDCREAFKEAILNPSCLTCLHGIWFEFNGVPIGFKDCNYMPPESETYDDQSQDKGVYYKAMAAFCGRWQIDPGKVNPQ